MFLLENVKNSKSRELVSSWFTLPWLRRCMFNDVREIFVPSSPKNKKSAQNVRIP